MTRRENDDVFILVVILAGLHASGRPLPLCLGGFGSSTERGPGNASDGSVEGSGGE